MNESADVFWDGSLESLFAILDGAYRSGIMPGHLYRPPSTDEGMEPGKALVSAGSPEETAQPELFADCEFRPDRGGKAEAGRRNYPPEGRFFPAEGAAAVFPDLRESLSAALLFDLSADAFDAFIFAWMSELPIEGEILRFGWKTLAAAKIAAVSAVSPATAAGAAGTAAAGGSAPDTGAPLLPTETVSWAACPEARQGAERAASDRGDPDVRAVLAAAYKAVRETDRLKGLLRFTPVNGGGENALYLAHCAPDHFILPALAEHFRLRFGAVPWLIVDERRGLALTYNGETPRLVSSRTVPALNGGRTGAPAAPPVFSFSACGGVPDIWKDLWQKYHRSINNESRHNPALQRRFMPVRYRKYLPEYTE
ncbi:MAG: TIGR03915 family putative DNA repair protein [Treponema sp.]|jgi:probable DNA metabolism protein|nr:TIGR03915 family putative DNA repair protein [Treponema sp.]